mmetsp:Transcript_13864/g.28122  ORF Transcript_13864/g.28122 Transcript_13864/m.28122 type:complete len:218 (-) Transcript_13864:255-908(-)
MTSKDAFLPVPTEEDSAIPTYRPDGPGSQSFAGSLSVEDGGGNDLGLSNTRNRDFLFCGVCCDYRRAVLVVNGITIGLLLMDMILVAIMTSYVEKNLPGIEHDISDDMVRYQLDGFVKEGGMQFTEAFVDGFGIVSIGLHGCGIYGALQFKQWGIITAGCTYAVFLILGIFSTNFPAVVMNSLFLYPHYYMLKLMKEGIMTDYNYHKIASCCGNRRM